MLTPNGRRLASEQTRDRPPQGITYWWHEPGTVATVTAGGASDGYDLVTVTYRGATQEAAYLDSYVPAPGDVVALSCSSDGSIFILGRLVGTP